MKNQTECKKKILYSKQKNQGISKQRLFKKLYKIFPCRRKEKDF